MGDKEMLLLFVLTFCLMGFGLQPKTPPADTTAVATTMVVSLDSFETSR